MTDVDNLESIELLESYVQQSDVVVIFITHGCNASTGRTYDRIFAAPLLLERCILQPLSLGFDL